MDSRTTIDLVPWDTLGPAATPNDLCIFRDAVNRAAEREPAVEDYETEILLARNGEPSLLRVVVIGTMRADVLVERAWNNGKFDAP
jgi:hypothetical protein